MQADVERELIKFLEGYENRQVYRERSVHHPRDQEDHMRRFDGTSFP